MKVAQLLHNPTAGDETHDSDNLKSLLRANGFECRYSSTKKEGWDIIGDDVDLLVVAGGDGTVRKVVKKLLKRPKSERLWPIAVVPLGTANNIAKTLGLRQDPETLVSSWNNWNIKKFDVGIISHFEEETFFIESYGHGLFPFLMRHMKKLAKEEEITDPQEALQRALDFLKQFVSEYKPVHCRIKVDGVDHTGEYVLVEVMNSRAIGPNLFLAPHAVPDDGVLEVVCVKEENRQKLADYVAARQQGIDFPPADFHIIKGKCVTIGWAGNHVHVDDQVFSIERNKEVTLRLHERLLEFLVP